MPIFIDQTMQLGTNMRPNSEALQKPDSSGHKRPGILLYDFADDQVADLFRTDLFATFQLHVGGVIAAQQNGRDGFFDRERNQRAAERVSEHHRDGIEQSDGICQTFASDIRRRSMHRFEHGWEFPLRIDVGSRRNADGPCDRRAKVRQDGTKRSHQEWAEDNGFEWYEISTFPEEFS